MSAIKTFAKLLIGILVLYSNATIVVAQRSGDANSVFIRQLVGEWKEADESFKLDPDYEKTSFYISEIDPVSGYGIYVFHTMLGKIKTFRYSVKDVEAQKNKLTVDRFLRGGRVITRHLTFEAPKKAIIRGYVVRFDVNVERHVIRVSDTFPPDIQKIMEQAKAGDGWVEVPTPKSKEQKKP